MSIVVHNGYRLEAGTDIFEFGAEFRRILKPERLEEDMILLIQRASDRIIQSIIGKEEPSYPKGFLANAFHEYRSEQAVRDTSSYDDDPNRCNLLIYPMVRGQHMVRLLCENKSLLNSFDQMDKVEDYAVDTRTDGEPDTGYEEWKRRAHDWDTLHNNALTLNLHSSPISDDLTSAVIHLTRDSEYTARWEEALYKFGTWQIKNLLTDMVLNNSGIPKDQLQERIWTVVSKASEIVVHSGQLYDARQNFPDLSMKILNSKEVPADPKIIESMKSISIDLGSELRKWFEKSIATGEWYN